MQFLFDLIHHYRLAQLHKPARESKRGTGDSAFVTFLCFAAIGAVVAVCWLFTDAEVSQWFK